MYIRGLPCAVCDRPAPSEAHHHTGGRGRGQKADDRRTIPLCRVCHTDFHAACGFFKFYDKAARREWQDRMVERYQRRSRWETTSFYVDPPDVPDDVF